MEYNFNYDKLRGKIREYCKTNRKYAEMLGVSEQTIQNKLNGNIPFNQKEIKKSQIILHISDKDIASIFFTENV